MPAPLLSREAESVLTFWFGTGTDDGSVVLIDLDGGNDTIRSDLFLVGLVGGRLLNLSLSAGTERSTVRPTRLLAELGGDLLEHVVRQNNEDRANLTIKISASEKLTLSLRTAST